MGMTMTQKILAAHAGLDNVKAGQLIRAKLDMVLGNDVTTPVAIKEFKAAGFEKVFDKKVTMGLVGARNARKEDNRGRMQPITKVTMKMHHPVREDLLRYLQSNITA